MTFRGMGLLVAALSLMGPVARAQDNKKAQGDAIIKTEARLVVVDAVVTDKKDKYVPDLTKKDFKVLEDGKEQQLKTFVFEADPNSPLNDQPHYLVLFFDNASMDLSDQQRARQAAEKFIDKNAGKNRLMAIVNFGGSLEVAQNFTDDADRLHQVVKGAKFPQTPSTAAANGGARLPSGMAALGARTSILGIRTIAKGIADVPGRKILVYITAGFPMSNELQTEVTATIDACNKANVAIYPLDVHGLGAGDLFGPASGQPGMGRGRGGRQGFLQAPSKLRSAFLALASGMQSPIEPAAYANSFQRGGTSGGGASGGGTTGGSTGGGTSSGGSTGAGAGASSGGGRSSGPAGGGSNTGSTGFGGTAGGGRTSGTSSGAAGAAGGRASSGGFGGGGSPTTTRDPNQQFGQQRFGMPRDIVPAFPPFASGNQQVLYMLAQGTGGFPILNDNDLLAGLEKIAAEQNQYYILGYTPAESPEGSCHTLKVEVSKGYHVRSRSGYCNTKSVDLLAGKPAERDLEARMDATGGGTIASAMQVTYVYTAADTARLDLAMDIPSEKLKFDKVKGKLHCDVNILGIAYKADGTVGARFSDTLKLEVEDKKELEKFTEKPVHYENQFDIASGKYTFKLAFTNGGADYGKLEAPLAIDSFEPKNFGMSALMLSKNVHRNNDQSGIQADLIEGRTPFTVGPMQIEPAGTNTFKKTDAVAIYCEIYEPLAAQEKIQIGAQLRVLDKKTGEQKVDSGMAEYTQFLRKPGTVAALGLKVPVADLAPGAYVLELKTLDNVGKTAVRTADFNVQ